MENLKILYRQGRYSNIYSSQVIAKIENNNKFDLKKFVNNEKYNGFPSNFPINKKQLLKKGI